MDDGEKIVSFGVIFVDHINVIDELPSKINQDIKFVDTQTWMVYEHYTINNMKIKRQIGFFSDFTNYVPTEHLNFDERRSNFQGKVQSKLEVQCAHSNVSCTSMMEWPVTHHYGFQSKDKISGISSPKLSLLSFNDGGLEIQLFTKNLLETCFSAFLAGLRLLQQGM